MSKGRRDGKWVFWYKNGRKQLEGEFVAGKKTGTWVKWDERGVKLTEGTFAFGKMHGPWTDWYPSGQKAQESHWFHGKRDGKWVCWSEEGRVERKESYDHAVERDLGYSLHTDLEVREIIRNAHTNKFQRNWEMLVGKTVGRLVKPWHVACWILLFVVAVNLIHAKSPWRGAALAAILALFVTSLIAWRVDGNRDE